MTALVLTSSAPLAGKTTVAVGLGRVLAGGGRRVAVLRLGGDAGADRDAALFAGLPFNAERRRQPASAAEAAAAAGGSDIALIEAPAGDPSDSLAALKAKAIAVARYPDAAEAEFLAFCRSSGDALLGIAVTAVPQRRLEAARRALEATNLRLIAMVPEDRTLASPTIEELAEALAAQTMFLDDQRQQVLDRILISSISADPGQGYFASYNPNAVIVRSDKPDLQIAALNAGVRCLVITGGLPLLSYVIERAEGDEIPLILTQHDTKAVIQVLEDLYPRTRFAGPAKVERIAALLAGGLEAAALDALTATR
ncbi:MAG: DRTGG domain-containing protein [Dehalococcoidia bacterium]